MSPTEQICHPLCIFLGERLRGRLHHHAHHGLGSALAKQDPTVAPQQAKDRIHLGLHRRIGRREIVIVEGYDPVSETYFCRSQAEAPEIDGKVYLTGAPKNSFSVGDMVDVTITEAMDCDLIAELSQF